MQIHKVELSDIKSYAAGSPAIHLERGLNFLHGKTGAGKSTVLQAIGFAVFDYCPYSPAKDFVRKGKNAGVMKVWFDPGDGRVYRATRRVGNNPAWTLHDDADDTPLCSGAEMGRWIAKALHIEDSTRLSRVFSDIIGVAQGRYTNAFAMKAGNDKTKHFDPILGVDVYARVESVLGGVENQQFRNAIDAYVMRLTDLNARIATKADVPARADALRGEIKALRDRVKALAAGTVAAKTRVDTWDKAKVAVDSARSAVQQAHAELQKQDLRLEQARSAHEEATAATEAVNQAMPGQQAHLAAEKELEALEKRRKERDAQQRIVDESEKAIEGLRSKVDEAKANADNAAREIAEESRALEKRVTADTKQRASLEGKVEKASTMVSQVDERIRAVAAFRRSHIEPLGKLLERVRADRDEIVEKRRSLARDKRGLDEAKEKRLRLLAKDVNERRRQHEAAKERAGTVQGQLTVAQDTRDSASRQVCPLLNDSCDRIGPEIMESRIRLLQNELDGARREEQKLYQAVLEANAAKEELPGIDTFRALLQDQEKQLDRAAERLLKTGAKYEPAAISAAARDLSRGVGVSAPALSGYDLSATDSAEERLRTLRESMEAIEDFEKTCCERLEESLTASRGEEAALKSDLASLLRGLKEAETQRKVLDQRAGQLEKTRTAIAEDEKRLAARLAGYAHQTDRLKVFQGLDGRYEHALLTRSINAEAHQVVAARQPVATKLDERARAFAEAQAAHGKLAAEHSQKTEGLNEAEKAYDEGAHETAREGHLTAIRLEEGVRTSLAEKQTEMARMDEELKEIETWIEERGRMERERARLQRGREATATFRHAFKGLGPRVARRLLAEISTRAAGIYRSLSAGPALLAWEENYDVFLDTPGEGRRSFTQLSGGEQMSAAIALQMAMVNEFSDSRFCIFDEPTSHLDEDRCGNLADAIRRIRADLGFTQLLLVSHDDTFGTDVEHVVEFEKAGGRTVIRGN